MLHAHLKTHADWVDETTYRVQFRNDLSQHANKQFQDSDGLDPSWMKEIWQRAFEMKLGALGASISPGQQVLDVCCGQGFLGEYFQERLNAVVSFTDLSPVQLSSVATRGETECVGRSTRVYGANILALPFRDSTFDLVIGNSFLHHLPDVPAALREMHRVMKPGGRLVLFHEPSIAANWWETFPLSLVKDTTYNSGFTDLWQFQETDLAALLRESAFDDIRIMGSGIVGALLCNWYLMINSKLRCTNRFMIKPALLFRIYLTQIELSSKLWPKPDLCPSLLIAATRA